MTIRLRHGILTGDEIWHRELSGLKKDILPGLPVYHVVHLTDFEPE